MKKREGSYKVDVLKNYVCICVIGESVLRSYSNEIMMVILIVKY